jgi:hypothetical protein
MKKNDMARLVLGMALLGSSLAGYGMESDEDDKSEKIINQKRNIRKEGEYYISSGKFMDYAASMMGKDSLKKAFGRGVYGVRGDQKYLVARALDDLALGVYHWIYDNPEKWLGKAREYFQKEMLNSEAFIDLLWKDPYQVEGFLNFLSKEPYSDYETRIYLDIFCIPRVGVFQKKNLAVCVEQIYSAIREIDGDVRCSLYKGADSLLDQRLVNKNKKDLRLYCMAFLDLQKPIGCVYYRDDRTYMAYPYKKNIERIETHTLVMVFEKDQPEDTPCLVGVYPWVDHSKVLEVLSDPCRLGENIQTIPQKDLKTKVIETVKEWSQCFLWLGKSCLSGHKKPKEDIFKTIESGKDWEKQVDDFFKGINLEDQEIYARLKEKIRALEDKVRDLEKVHEMTRRKSI